MSSNIIKTLCVSVPVIWAISPMKTTAVQTSAHFRCLPRRTATALDPPPNFGVKLARPGFGPPAEPATSSPAWRRHGGCNPPLAAGQFIGGNRRAAPASGTRDRPCSLHQGR